jgi:hypothetical protein
MEKQKLDNGMLPLAWLCNVVFPLTFGVYYAIRDWMNNTSESLLLVSCAISFALIFAVIFFRYRRVEFDKQNMYILNIFNMKVAEIHFSQIEEFEQGLINFGGKNGNAITGKNYKISYQTPNGELKSVKVMATADNSIITRFERSVEEKGRFADIIS